VQSSYLPFLLVYLRLDYNAFIKTTESEPKTSFFLPKPTVSENLEIITTQQYKSKPLITTEQVFLSKQFQNTEEIFLNCAQIITPYLWWRH